MDAELLAEGYGAATRASWEAAATGDFEETLAACAFDDAALILLRKGVTAQAIPLLPHVTGPWLALALAARLENASDVLLAAARAVPVRDKTTDVAAAYLLAAVKAGAPRERVIAATRLASRRTSSYLGSSLMIGLAEELADATLTKVFGKVAELRKQVDTVRATAERAWKLSVDEIGATLPAQSGHMGATLRAAPRVGRNEPCPCGSGQKYKKCCADKPEATAVLAAVAAERITVEQVEEIPLTDLAKLDLAKLKDPQLAGAFRRYLHEGLWDHAERCGDELGHRHPGERDDYIDELVFELRNAREIERARVAIARIGNAEYRADHEIELALAAAPAGQFALLDDAARKVVDTESVYDFAITLLRQVPALGILVARGCVLPKRLLDAQTVMEGVEDARDELCLPPEDPHWALYDALVATAKAAAKDDEGEEVRAALTERVDRLKRDLKSKEAQLAARGSVQTVVTTATVEPEKVRDLKTTIEELRGLVAEGNAERAELRRELATARASTPAPVVATIEPAETDDDGDSLDPAIRSVTLPALDPAARSALDRVPRTVAAESMRLLGALCAGDPWTWNRVKLARDMAKPVLMARVGIHHRLLLRPDGDELRVLDLIAREDLDTTLRKLRRG